MNQLKKIITQNLSGKRVLAFFIASTMVYIVMASVTVPKLIDFSGGMQLLDILPMGYDMQYMNTLFDKLGAEGRNYYLFKQLPLDMIYPFLSGISYCLIIAFFLKKLGKLDSNFFYLCLVPLISGLADYSENIGIIAMLKTYPESSNSLVQFSSISTIVKSMLGLLFFTTTLILLILFGIKVLKGRKNNSTS